MTETSDDLERHLRALSPAKRELLRRRLAASAPAVARDNRIRRRTTPGPWPTSYSQQRFWFLDLYDAGSPIYNQPRLLRMEGDLAPKVLEQAFCGVIERHEALRTVITAAAGDPQQRVLDHWRFTLPVVDLSSASPTDRTRQVETLVKEERRRRFDLSADLMIRATLVRFGPRDHRLLVVSHHIASDHWSSNLLMRELAALYAALLDGLPSPLPPLSIQYADYAIWEREQLEGGQFDNDLEFWLRELAGPLPQLQLPTDRPRPPQQTFRGERCGLELSRELTGALTRAARSQRTTPFGICMAVLQTLLHRYSGQADIVVGFPIANRQRVETEQLVGNLINSLALRTDFSDDPTVAQLVDRVRGKLFDAVSYNNVPFARLVEAVQPVRDPSRSPIFDVMLDFANVPRFGVSFPGVRVTRLPIAHEAVPLDLSLYLREHDGQLTGSLEYSTDLFDPETASRMAGHFVTLAEAMSRQPETRVSQLPLMGDAERRQVTVAWNATAVAIPDQTVHELVEAQAAQTPESVAVEADGGQLRYGELDRRANQLAHHLRSLGVRSGDRVGICLARSTSLVAAVLGVLKSGAAYVPLDPSYPMERLAFMADDAALAAVVTEAPSTAWWDRYRVVAIDTEARAIAAQPSTPVETTVGGDDLAYVVYTSGSTGRPKGVCVPHRCVVNFLTSMAATPGLTSDDTLLAVTTLSFDISVLELLLPLTVGARVWVVDTETTADGLALARTLTTSGATVMQATPATWRLLFEAGWTGSQSLRVLCGGERLPVDLAERLTNSVVEVWNMYGPTETTVWSTCGPVTAGAPMTVGWPIANTQVYVVDAQGQLVPIGVMGEVYLGGAGVTAGYWNQPAMTVDRFVADAWSAKSGSRSLYRTGDVGRWRADGTLEIHGRLDRQVKLRGYRIEPGEIEAVVATHPDVQACVVELREVGPGDVRLVAYVVPGDGAEVEGSTVRELVRARLPGYMVPSLVMPLPALPLTPNGKVDRQALPAPVDTGPAAEEFAPPESRTERQVAAIWAEVLGVERVGLHDNFFELGGHSLLLMKAVARLEETLGVKVAVQEFIYQTVGQLAALCDEKLAAEAPRPARAASLWSRLLRPQVK